MAVIPPTRGMCRKFHGMTHSIPANLLEKLVEWKPKLIPTRHRPLIQYVDTLQAGDVEADGSLMP